MYSRHLQPHQHGITGNDPAAGKPRDAWLDRFFRHPMLPRLLAEHGYLTMHTGKYWLRRPADAGFTRDMSQTDRHGCQALDNGWNEFGKFSPYENGVRTPIVLRWPKRVFARVDRERLASNIDIMLTILAAVDDPASSLQSRTCIHGNWKLIDWRAGHKQPTAAHPAPARKSPHATVELFNLAEDPMETGSRAEQEPAAVGDLRKRLDAWWNPP